MNAFDFLVVMTFTSVGVIHPSLAALVNAARMSMTREGLHLRFNSCAVSFMQRCVEFILKQKVNSMVAINSHLLNRFKSIKIFDSTSWDINPLLSTVFPGCGGNASNANCKIQLCYEYLSASLTFFDITSGNKPDSGYTAQVPKHINAGELLLADLGYFSTKSFNRIVKNSAYFLSRFFVTTTMYDAKTKKRIDLKHILKKAVNNAYELDVVLGAEEKNQVRCRLICLRVSDEIAQIRRRKLRRNAAKKKKNVTEERMYMAGWTLLVTNIPNEWLPAEKVRDLYSLRWQIELLFKQLKSVLCIQKTSTTKEDRFRCEVLGKLIVAILIHRIHSQINCDYWNNKQQEISMDKLYKRIKERAFLFSEMLIISLSKAISYLKTELERVLKDCIKISQKSRLTTLQKLDCKTYERYVEKLDTEALT